MSSSWELLVLRLAMVVLLLGFGWIVATTLRGGVSSPEGATSRRGSRSGRARLVVVSPGSTSLRVGSSFAVAGQMTIGRDDSNGVMLADESVSSRHAMLRGSAAEWAVFDLGSTNGTFLNGRPVGTSGASVQPGDTLAFGVVVLRFTR